MAKASDVHVPSFAPYRPFLLPDALHWGVLPPLLGRAAGLGSGRRQTLAQTAHPFAQSTVQPMMLSLFSFLFHFPAVAVLLL